jgi:membrane fusion protein, multidrug efflux system
LKPFGLSLLFFVVLIAALASTGCNKGDAAANETRAKPVRVEKISRGNIADVLSYPATLRAYNEVRVFSTIPDRILEFPWEDGDEIDRGERVALIKKAGMDQGLANMSAQVEGLDAQIANLESELERTKGLLSAGAVAQTAYDRLDTQLKSLRAQRKAMLAARGQLAVQAGNAYITAPISGVIANKALEKGDMAAPQIPLCRILGIDRLKVDIRLVEADIPRVFPGQQVKLHFDAYPDETFEGKVTSILPYMDPATRTNTVEVTLDNPKDGKTGHRRLKPGMFGRAELIVAMRDNVVVVPEPALLLDNEILAKQKPGERLRKAMIVDADNIARTREVRCGARKGSMYEVLDGLKEGDRIIVRGQHALQDGTHVEIMEASPQ